MGLLQLEVLDFDGPTRWQRRLTEQPGGRFLADHQVDLDDSAAEYEAFTDLAVYLRWNAAPDRRLESEAELAAEVGRWIGEQVLDRGFRGMAKTRPHWHTPVRDRRKGSAHGRAAGLQPPAGGAAGAGGAVDRPPRQRLGAAPLARTAVPHPRRLRGRRRPHLPRPLAPPSLDVKSMADTLNEFVN